VSAVTWQQLLEAAKTPDDVIAAARDFVASVDHVELARLPEGCKPGKLFDTHDVASYAYDLARHHCNEVDPTVVEAIHKLSAFFSQAVARLSQLAGAQPANREVVRLFRS
jgi:hypothetical protein